MSDHGCNYKQKPGDIQPGSIEGDDVSDYGYNYKMRAGMAYVLEVEREGNLSDRRFD